MCRTRLISPGLCLFFTLFCSALQAADNVVLQLPWFHQFQFAGYYAAQAQGFYQEEGLEVSIRAGMDQSGHTKNPVEEVVFQRAQFGVTRSDLLVHHARGLPVIMLATVMQRTPAAFITLDRYHISRLEELSDKPVSLPLIADSPDTVIDIEVITSLARAGVAVSELNNRVAYWELSALESGKSQMIFGYASDEPYILRQRGLNPVVISPIDYGIDLYGDLLFTSESTLRTDPELVERFRRASLKGWDYALKHPEKIALHILNHYPLRSDDYDLAFLLQEATLLREYIQPDLVEIGYSNPARWKRILNVYREIGINDPVDLDRFIYKPADGNSLVRWRWLILTVILTMLIIIGWLFRARLHLVKKVQHSEQRESQLRQQAETDPLTGLVNRRRFSLELDVSYLRAKQTKTALSMLMLDVDHFKNINDEFGHLAGDAVLYSLARVCEQVIRETDVLCRYGGEEFAFLLPDSSRTQAVEVAERLMTAVRNDRVQWEHHTISYTVSIGIAELKAADKESVDLLRRTDRHLYQAKADGRDTISIGAVVRTSSAEA
jgi:diguanylate cyclase (GGDEF)-like protein